MDPHRISSSSIPLTSPLRAISTIIKAISPTPPEELTGVYFGWKSFALDHIPLSEHTGFCGDAFVAKTPVWECDENGAVYEDFPIAFVRSPLLGIMVERMHDR